MAVSFGQACAIVREALEPDWPTGAGTFMVAAQGFEDAGAWHVVAGAREALEDDPAYVLMDWPALLVDKATGELSEVSVLDNLDRLGAMRPCGRRRWRPWRRRR